MKNQLIILILLLGFGSKAQVDNTIYGLYQVINPPSFQLASIDPLTGQISTIGSSILSSVVNATGAALNPYTGTYTYQDDDSWLTIDLQTGSVVNDMMVSLPNVTGNFDNFRFNSADSMMYGLFSQVINDPITGFISSDLRLASCDLSSGMVNLISSSSIAQSFTMSGSAIDPHLMIYYFETEGKFMGLDLYSGQIYSQPTVSIAGGGSSFDNFAYSCADTSVYGLIMDNGIKALGKIDPLTGVVSALPTTLNFDNYVMNTGGAIDPENLIYYFQTMDITGGIKLVGLSLLDGSVVSESFITPNGDYFIMYRIQSDCYSANPTRLNPAAASPTLNNTHTRLFPNPSQDILNLKTNIPFDQIEIIDMAGMVVQSIEVQGLSVQIPINSLMKGVYLLNICSDQYQEHIRFVKE